MPFLEEDGDRLLPHVLATGRLHATSDADAAQLADAVICVIGTPVDEHLNPQTHAFYHVIKELGPHLHDGQTLILRSTVYPGLSARIHAMFRDFGPDVHVSFCPERVAQGHSLREIISAFDEVGLEVARAIFGRFATQLIEVDPVEAELAKLFCNCYRYITRSNCCSRSAYARQRQSAAGRRPVRPRKSKWARSISASARRAPSSSSSSCAAHGCTSST
jgi:UDP-N-acetyl-D-mannosaminuronic acid dehydrogenase